MFQLNRVAEVYWKLLRRTWRNSTRLGEEPERRNAG
jgi:hypothetical protein